MLQPPVRPPPKGPVMFHGLEIAERIRIVQRPVLAESFDVIGPLHVMAQGLGRVAAGKQVAETIEIDAPGIAAPLGKELELFGARMIPPNPLLELDAADFGRDGASLRSVQPAVRSPRQRIGERMARPPCRNRSAALPDRRPESSSPLASR